MRRMLETERSGKSVIMVQESVTLCKRESANLNK